MKEKIRSFSELSGKELRTRPVVVCSEGAIRCRNLPLFAKIIKENSRTIIAMAEQELEEGSRGRAKAQILASIKGVEDVVACSKRDLEVLVSGEFGPVRQIGNIFIRDRKAIFTGEIFAEEIRIEQVSSPVDRKFMECARKLVPKSTCWWRPPACVFVRNEEIIMTGVSLNPRQTNCKKLSIKPTDIWLAPGKQLSFCDAIHAEKVGIAHAAKEGVSLNGTHLYVTTCPCEECSKVIIEVGISRVVFDSEYYDRAGLRLLKERGVQIKKIKNE